MLRKWNELPEYMKTVEVRHYYDSLKKKTASLMFKRAFDITASAALLVSLWPVMAAIAVLIAQDSSGGILFRQERVTQYGRKFHIHKFRTMVFDSESESGHTSLTNDKRRITRIGAKLRKLHLDELPQLIDIFMGNMSFVGTRPEIPKYVENYTPEMMATLLLPAGVTSEASVRYTDEYKLLENAQDVSQVYVEQVLPEKMAYNLKSLESFCILDEIKIMVMTAALLLPQPKKAHTERTALAGNTAKRGIEQ